MNTIAPPRPLAFENLLAVLNRQEPDRPTLFEFIIDPRVLLEEPEASEPAERLEQWIRAFVQSGYDFASLPPWLTGTLEFPTGERHHGESISQNEGVMIEDEAGFARYPWPDPDAADLSPIPEWARLLPDRGKFVVMAPGGVLENLTDLMGFENLCFHLMDEPELVERVVDAIGSRLLRFYERHLEYDCVGAAVVNDDWGHRTQTMLNPGQMRRFIIPWHKRIVEAIHAAGRPAILHSCGNLETVWEDIIETCGYDGKHSYEDAILPVEDAYARFGERIAVIGGMDVDFLCRESPEAVRQRALGILEASRGKGGYALGTGNSITPYLPRENVRALLRVALDAQT